jgi:glyoxylase-like metal-dependent hydrolase (beta-lactamase superfamily II)
MTKRGEPTLVEVADGVHAYLQRGGWGYSNAGLLARGGGSLLVDTLYDVRATKDMLRAMRRVLPGDGRIQTLVNTHANGDHCWGNQLVSDANIISSRAAAEEMLELSPRTMQAMLRAARVFAGMPPRALQLIELLGRLGVPRVGALAASSEFLVECFGDFDFGGVRLTLPKQTFEGSLSLTVGDEPVELMQVGPAHTKGDAIVYLPKARVVFTGDILFIGSHPIIWQGPVQNWIDACDRLLALDVDVIVPGHGPITDKQGVRDTKAYWQRIIAEAQRAHAAGATPDDAARGLLAERFVDWSEEHRLVANVDAVYRERCGVATPPDPVSLFARMAQLARSPMART